jgi:hypothetical protein
MRRVFLVVAVGSITLGAILGVTALLWGGFGETEGKVLATSLLVTLASGLSLAAVPALDAGRLWVIPHAGIAGAVVGSLILITGVWEEFDPEWLPKLGVSFVVPAAAAALASLLSAWELPGRAGVLPTIVDGVATLAAGMVVAGIWGELDSSVYWRVFGVVAVLLAAGILVIPVLHHYGGAGEGDAPVRFCPFCGTGLADRNRCEACGRRFRVR